MLFISDSICFDDNICTTEKCIDGKCITSPNPNVNDLTCCQHATDCPESACSIAHCPVGTYTCYYESVPCQSETDNLSILYNSLVVGENESTNAKSDTAPGVGDVVGAVIGFIILGVLIVAFVIVVVLMIIQKIIRKITAERS